MALKTTLPIYADASRQDIKQRLSRAEGQLRGIARMLDEQRPCAEVLQQLASVQAVLKGVTKSVLRNYLEKCVTQAIKEGESEIYDDLMETIHRFVK